MGLNFKGAAAHWSYSGFSRFREALARELGINLQEMRGFGGDKSWDKIKDPIVLLLNHSDCEGSLSAQKCALVAPRLRELVAHWDDSYDRMQALLLAEGMEHCALKGLSLQFC